MEDMLPDPTRTKEVLSKIKKIETDNDWDGIAAALIAQLEIREREGRTVPINVSDAKIIPSDASTLVLDKTTDGDGYVVDHHPGKMAPKQYLAFCSDGTVPASSLMYRMLPKEGRSPAKLLLAATGEIMDGLYERGAKDGAVKEAFERMQWLALPSKHKTQFLKTEELYSIADVLGLLTTLDSNRALEVGAKLSLKRIETVEDVISLCDKEQKAFVEKYFGVMENFPYEKFREAKIGKFGVSIAQDNELEFPLPSLARMLTEKPGNYVLFKSKGLSIRTQDSELVGLIVNRLGDNVASYGGRVGWYGVQFKDSMKYEQFSETVMKNPVKVI